jgi:hypothetical protein
MGEGALQLLQGQSAWSLAFQLSMSSQKDVPMADREHGD